MSKWRVWISEWVSEVEADDEGDALMKADDEHCFMAEARAEEVTDEPADD